MVKKPALCRLTWRQCVAQHWGDDLGVQHHANLGSPGATLEAAVLTEQVWMPCSASLACTEQKRQTLQRPAWLAQKKSSRSGTAQQARSWCSFWRVP